MARTKQQAERFEKFRAELAAGKTVPEAAIAAGYSPSFARSRAYQLAEEARKPVVTYETQADFWWRQAGYPGFGRKG